MKKIIYLLILITLSTVVFSANEFKYYRVYVNTSGTAYGQFANGFFGFMTNGTNGFYAYSTDYGSNPTGPPDAVGWIWNGISVKTFTNHSNVGYPSGGRPYIEDQIVSGNQPNVYVQVNLDQSIYIKNFTVSHFSSPVGGDSNASGGGSTYIGNVTIMGSNDNSTWITLSGRGCRYEGWCNLNNSLSSESSSFIRVTNNSVNFTSDGGQKCGYNGSQYIECDQTQDDTPTFRFTTTSDATCKLYNESKTYAEADALGVSDCGTTGTTSHICTYTIPLKIGVSTIYAICGQTEYIDADYWNISIGYDTRNLQEWRNKKSGLTMAYINRLGFFWSYLGILTDGDVNATNVYASNLCYTSGNCGSSGGNSSFNQTFTDARYLQTAPDPYTRTRYVLSTSRTNTLPSCNAETSPIYNISIPHAGNYSLSCIWFESATVTTEAIGLNISMNMSTLPYVRGTMEYYTSTVAQALCQITTSTNCISTVGIVSPSPRQTEIDFVANGSSYIKMCLRSETNTGQTVTIHSRGWCELTEELQ
jgi:hypothetical protein